MATQAALRAASEGQRGRTTEEARARRSAAQGEGGSVLLEGLALEVDARKGCFEFLVLNVSSFQNKSPVGPTSNLTYTQTPNPISTVSRKPCERVQVSLPAKASLLRSAPSEGGPGRPGKETERDPRSTRSAFQGSRCSGFCLHSNRRR